MSKQKELSRLVALLERFPIVKIRKLRIELTPKPQQRIFIPEKELRKFIEQNRSTNAIAKFFKTSQRTVTRRIKEYGLTGIRPRGRKTRSKAPKKPKI